MTWGAKFWGHWGQRSWKYKHRDDDHDSHGRHKKWWKRDCDDDDHGHHGHSNGLHGKGHHDHGNGYGWGHHKGGKDDCQPCNSDKFDKYTAKAEKYLARSEYFRAEGNDCRADKFLKKAEKFQAKADKYKCEEPNEAPEILSPANQDVLFFTDEALDFVVDVEAVDPNAEDILIYSLSGEDAGSFTIDQDGVIQTVAGLPSAGSADGDSGYEITVNVADPDGLTDTIDLAIVLTDGA